MVLSVQIGKKMGEKNHNNHSEVVIYYSNTTTSSHLPQKNRLSVTDLNGTINIVFEIGGSNHQN